MQSKFSVIFGGAIAGTLLILYTFALTYMSVLVFRAGQVRPDKAIEFSSGLTYVSTMIGGLVAALVIAKLAITKPGKNPGVMRISADENGMPNEWVTRLSIAYLVIWLVTGLLALVVGTMLYPNVNQTLNDIGTTWLGLAVASGYAYFGIKPEG
jgi:hypothetical protein